MNVNWIRLRLVSLAVLIILVSRSWANDDTPASEPAVPGGEFTAELNGLKLWYKVSGTGPVCIMPSSPWGVSSDLYFRTLKPLEKTFTIVYLDPRGTGRSQRAKSGKEYTWNLLVADLDALRAHLKQEKVWLMGHSEGGILVLHYACAHPDQVRGLVLLNSVAVTDARQLLDEIERRQRRKNQPWFQEAMKALQAVPKTDAEMASLAMKFLPLEWSDANKMEKFKDDFAATTMSVDARRGQTESKRFPIDLIRQLKKVSAPTLIVVGDDDPMTSPMAAQRLHLCLRNSKLLLIEKCGHFPWLEQPREFEARVPEFLEALGLSRK